MENMRDRRSRNYNPSAREQQGDNRKQLLGFDEVNFEQRREPYRGRVNNTSNKRDHQNSDRTRESR